MTLHGENTPFSQFAPAPAACLDRGYMLSDTLGQHLKAHWSVGDGQHAQSEVKTASQSFLPQPQTPIVPPRKHRYSDINP